MIVESAKVAYAGEDPFQEVGAIGRVLSLSGSGAHVQWETGPKQGTIDLNDLNDLVETGRDSVQRTASKAVFDSFADTLDIPSMPMLQVRAAYDEGGEEGLLLALSEAGRLSMLAEYAEEAVGLLATRLRQDPDFSMVLAQLDSDEADSMVGKVASLVLADRIGEG